MNRKRRIVSKMTRTHINASLNALAQIADGQLVRPHRFFGRWGRDAKRGPDLGLAGNQPVNALAPPKQRVCMHVCRWIGLNIHGG